jgi:hypothetical protein
MAVSSEPAGGHSGRRAGSFSCLEGEPASEPASEPVSEPVDGLAVVRPAETAGEVYT